MKLLIHDLNETEWNAVASRYEGWEIISDKGDISPCVGCFGCWLQTPGRCVIKDGYDRMGELIHKADEVVIISRYTYGGFSSSVKNILDRSIGYILPFFRIYKGEMHHKPRYQEVKPVTFVFRGSGITETDKEKAGKYAEAVRTNFNARISEIRFEECDPVEKEPVSVSMVSGKTVLLNCSLRGDNANSRKFLEVAGSNITGDVDILNLSSYVKKPDELAGIIMSAEKIVLGMPLYVDGIPSPVLRLMEKLEREFAGDGRKIYVVANMGFYESRQIENLLSMVKSWCEITGFSYCGGIAIGAGEMMGQVLKFGSNGPGKYVHDDLSALGKAVDSARTMEDKYTKANKFPRFLYFLAANSGMKKSLKVHKKQ